MIDKQFTLFSWNFYFQNRVHFRIHVEWAWIWSRRVSNVPPRLSFQQQQPHTLKSGHFSSSPILPAKSAQGVRSGDYQAKNSVFSNALSSPVRQSLQHYHSPLSPGWLPFKQCCVFCEWTSKDENTEANFQVLMIAWTCMRIVQAIVFLSEYLSAGNFFVFFFFF